MRMRQVVAAMGLALLVAMPARAAEITLQSANVVPNAEFLLPIGISNVEDLLAFTLEVTFDPAIIALEGVREGSFLSSGGATLPCTIGEPGELFVCATGPGSVSIGNFLLAASGVSSTGLDDVLAVLVFRALDFGTTTVDISLVSLANSLLEDIGPNTVVPGTVTVANTPSEGVPEPSTMLVLGIGLAGLARRQWRAARQPERSAPAAIAG